MRRAWRWVAIFAVVFYLAGLEPNSPATAKPGMRPIFQGTILAMVGPTSCPAGGCAAGQRMNMRFDFELSSYSVGTNPNVKVCFYAPNTWAVSADNPATVVGELTGLDYDLVGNCAEDDAEPDGYSLIAAREASINVTTFSDSIPLAFRFSNTAGGSGRIVARLFEKAGDSVPFTRTQQSTTSTLTITAAGTPSYVANDAPACGSNSPCYINSADDFANGVGTGLRDAIEASAAGSTISVLGNYTIKSNTVVVDRAITLTGINDATLTYSQAGACTQPMLSLRAGITLRELTVNDGSCANPGRGLVEVNSSQAVIIESNNLVNGDNAIFVRDNTGAVTVRYNHITGNTGYGVYVETHTNNAPIEITANNLNDNRPGSAVECSAAASGPIANRKANHNYWGATSPTQENSHCTISAGKRLGAPVTQKTASAGVNALLVTVGSTKAYSFDNQIAYRRNGGNDFGLFIVDHGFIPSDSAPFTTAAGGESPSPCSNYWDVFLPDGTAPTGALELFFKYDKTSACLAAINSNQYCDQTATPAKYPLYWYDPATNATNWWDTTGARPENLTSGEGQATSCNISANEIQVTIDSSGRPNLTGDLNYTPFMVGIPILRTFVPLASNQTINVTWTTNNEPDVQGFYVLRSLDGVNFSPISDLIARRGSALTGIITPAYSFIDSGRVNGVTYYYRLQIVRTDGRSLYSVIYPVSANIATITPTFTASPTFTRTVPRPTNTFPPTRIPTQRPTIRPVFTSTPRPLSTTVTPFILRTATPLGTQPDAAYPAAELVETAIALGTLELTPGYPIDETEIWNLTEIAFLGTETLSTGTASATPQPTPSETIFPASTPESSLRPGAWASLLIGLLAGSVVVGGIGGWWYFRVKT